MRAELPLLGFGLPVSGAWASPDIVDLVAGRAEQLGYATLWTFQRLLYPADRILPASHGSVLDSIAALAYVAGRTERIGIGTATICAPLTTPLALAKAMASLDVLSRGRLTVGLGIGWLPQEYEAAGVPFERRGDRMEEYLRCLHALWTDDPVEFAGDFYEIPKSHVAPSPVQRPHPPLLLGGSAPKALRRAGRMAEGWICSSGHDASQIAASIRLVREGAMSAGRDPDALRIVVRAVPEVLETEPGGTRPLWRGTYGQVLQDLALVRSHGVTEVFFDLNLSPQVGFPDVAPSDAVAHADRLLEAFAPINLLG